MTNNYKNALDDWKTYDPVEWADFAKNWKDEILDALSVLSDPKVIILPLSPNDYMLHWMYSQDWNDIIKVDPLYFYKSIIESYERSKKYDKCDILACNCGSYHLKKEYSINNDCPGCNVCFDCPEKR